jgi:hypothetical protein
MNYQLSLTADEFQFLGSLIGHHVIGTHPCPETIFQKLHALNNNQSFDELNADTRALYVRGPLTRLNIRIPANCIPQLKAISGEIVEC